MIIISVKERCNEREEDSDFVMTDNKKCSARTSNQRTMASLLTLSEWTRFIKPVWAFVFLLERIKKNDMFCGKFCQERKLVRPFSRITRIKLVVCECYKKMVTSRAIFFVWQRRTRRKITVVDILRHEIISMIKFHRSSFVMYLIRCYIDDICLYKKSKVVVLPQL